MLTTSSLIFAAIMSAFAFAGGVLFGFRRGLFAGLAIGVTSTLLRMEEKRQEALDAARTQDVSL